MNKRLKALISILVAISFAIPTTIIFNEASATPNLIVSEIDPAEPECCEPATVYAKVNDPGTEIEKVQVRFYHPTLGWMEWNDMDNFAADFWRYNVSCFNETGGWKYEIKAQNVTQLGYGYWTTFDTTTFTVVDTTPPEIIDVEINGTSPPTTIFCCDRNVNFTAKITDSCCNVTNASIWYDGPAGTGHWWMKKDGDDIWYYEHPHFNCTHVGLWNFTVNASDCADPANNNSTSKMSFTVMFRSAYINKTYGEPKWIGSDPDPWHPGLSNAEAVWITSSTPINLTAPPCYKVWYRIWNFTGGWGSWQPTGKRWEEFTISDYYDRDSDECKHKIEYRSQDCNGTNYTVHHQYFYVDDRPPVTTKEYGEPKHITEGEEICISCETPIYLNCTDGEWNIQNKSCPVGVNGTWVNITNEDNGNYTGWVFFPGSQTTFTMNTFPGNHSWGVFNDTNHTISYYQVDKLGNKEEQHNQTFYLDCTPPSATCDPYAEVEIDCDCCCGNPARVNATAFVEDFEDGAWPPMTPIGPWTHDVGDGTGSWEYNPWIMGYLIGAVPLDWTPNYVGCDSFVHSTDVFNATLSTPPMDLSRDYPPYYLEFDYLVWCLEADILYVTVNGEIVKTISPDPGGYFKEGTATIDISEEVALNPTATVIGFRYSTNGLTDSRGCAIDNVVVQAYMTEGTAIYQETIPDPENESANITVYKQRPGGCFNITSVITDDTCCPEACYNAVLKVYGPGYDAAAVPPTQYWEFNMTNLGGMPNVLYYEFCNTTEIGLYTFVVEVTDCVGNTNTTTCYGLVKPLCDIDIVELIEPDPSKWHPHMPTIVRARIKNNGILGPECPINVHLQVYEEQPFNLTDWYCSDEDCILNTWEVYSWDGDPVSWVWTEKKSFTPTHSWCCHPDYMDTYEAYSHDSLILTNHSATGLYIPEEIEGHDGVYKAYLNFTHWCEGEEYYDYGNVYIMNSTDGITWEQTQLNAESYFDTEDKWVWAGPDGEGFDISDYIGQYVKINFTWFSDGYMNYEGWYIDRVCIQLQYGSRQPLVYQEYIYVTGLNQSEERIIEFPLNFEPKNDTWYFFEVYSDRCGDYDGPADHNYILKTDTRTGFTYKDPLNGVNMSIYFGDVCDAAITYIYAPPLVEMPEDGLAEIPIDVTVCNTGTLTEDVPVKVSAKLKIRETLFFDDMEGEFAYDEDIFPDGGRWEQHDFGSGDAEWNFTEYNFYSPYTSLGFFDDTYHYDAGHISGVMYNVPDIDWDKVRGNPNADIIGKCNALLNEHDSLYPAFRIHNQWLRLISDAAKITGPTSATGGWIEFSFNDLLEPYITNPIRPDVYNVFDLAIWYAENNYGFTADDDFGFGFFINNNDADAWTNTYGKTDGPWAGPMIDDFEMYVEYEGEEVWSDTKIVEDLEQLECEDLRFWWNTTEYCDYIIKAEVLLDCDQDKSNDNMTTPICIYEQISTDLGEYTLDDNTCNLPDHWHIVEECSMCPEDYFWWCGNEELDPPGYADEWNDCLYINHTFNWSDPSITSVKLSFDTYYDMETNADLGYAQISNDSGLTWFTIDTFTGGNGGWETLSYTLDPTVIQPILLNSPYTGFDFTLPSNFFTDEMEIRFKFTSDVGTTAKGWFIDDVDVDMYNGTWNDEFYDSMQDEASSNENWTHMQCCVGNHWHEEDTFGAPAPTSIWFWNGEARSWTDFPGIGVPYYREKWNDPYMAPGWDWEWGPLDGGNTGRYTWGSDPDYDDAFGVIQGTVASDFVDIYYNTTNASTIGPIPDKPTVTLDIGAFVYTELSFATPHTFYVRVNDSTLSKDYSFTISTLGTTPQSYLLNITDFAGSPGIDISIHVNDTFAEMEGVFFDWVKITTLATGPVLNYQKYYNNVDEKIIFEINLTKAYEAIFSWAQNYSFANMYDDDYGVLEIFTDGEWKALFIIQGDSGGQWGDMKADISEYVGGDENTQIRFRFISNETEIDYGWLIDNISVEGKLDNVPPEVYGVLDPVEPDGNHGWYVGPVTVKLTATDNIEVAEIKYRIDGGTWLTYTAPFAIAIDGEHTVDYYAVDTVGNEAAHATLSFKIDTTAPTGEITVPKDGYLYIFGSEIMPTPIIGKTLIIGPLTAEATASDATSGVDYVTFATSKGSVEDAVSPYQYNLPFYLIGTDTLTVSVTDDAGNLADIGSVDYIKIL